MRSPFKRFFSKNNWKYVLGELLLIVLGISIALWFNNLNEVNKERKLEQQLLKELEVCLKQDLEDAKSNQRSHESGVESIDLLYEALQHPNEAPDTLIPYINGGARWTFLVSNSSTYESLKSIGFQIIQNDTLRNEISTLYNVDYKFIYELEKNHQINVNRLTEVIVKLPSYENGELTLSKKRFETRRVELLSMFSFTLSTHQSIARQYQQKVIPALEHLIQRIQREVY